MLEKFIELIILRFGLYISNIRLTKLLYIYIEAWLGISIVNKFQYFVLTEVTSQNVIIIILKYIYTEIRVRE